ncbi:ATP-binding cassette sub-family B member 7, putative [Cryptosporidium muris RN66]|uniref:ATP-binding casette sub-family B member 7, putative n=1 Tax=Cryptosporidium muris (strain RN66) TaxID=441375 RepID=B6AGU4_CRYMR|nr:ATP-binding cassette sub-family B member 7, putative [Cryptosporidium muris RN66]EEA07435.1 ATP-binding casette sub-family B member 7, putative [Cryptosporidium muris RN66]|eukprot:XP_002141784.1 ATP-binding casette sub-family B member 7 [Cryptosporidium muris RN66]
MIWNKINLTGNISLLRNLRISPQYLTKVTRIIKWEIPVIDTKIPYKELNTMRFYDETHKYCSKVAKHDFDYMQIAHIKHYNKDIRSKFIKFLKKSKILKKNEADAFEYVSAFIWPKNKYFRLRVVFATASLALAKVATVQAPIILAKLIDSMGHTKNVFPSLSNNSPLCSLNYLFLEPSQTLLLLIASYGIARISSSGFNELRNALFSIVSQSACRDVSLQAFHHFHNNCNLDFIQSQKSGELLTIVSRGFKSVSQLLNIMLFQIIPTSAEFILVLSLLFYRVGWDIAFITLATMLGYMEFTRKITAQRTLFRKEMNQAEQNSNGLFQDTLMNAEILKYLNAEEYAFNLYNQYQEKYMKSNIKVQTSLALLNFGQNLIFTGGLISTMLLTTGKILAGSIPMGSIVLVTSLLFQLAIPLNFIGMMYRETKLTVIDLNRLNEFFKQPVKLISHKYMKPIYPVTQDSGTDTSKMLKLENVWFSYPLESSKYEGSINTNSFLTLKPTLCDVSFSIPLGGKIGIVGPSGCGKSTLSRLFYRIYDPSQGRILYFNKELQEYNLHDFRRLFSIVPQENLLLNCSIMDNLRIANIEASDNEIMAACKLARIHDNILQKHDQYQTIVGERGSKLSGGERQRIGLARLFLRKSPIWILDEPTSSLDLHTQNEVIDTINSIYKRGLKTINTADKLNSRDFFEQTNYKDDFYVSKLIEELTKQPLTMMIIAHRLSTVKDSNIIIYMENGQVAEIGTHSQLMENKRNYAILWEKQLYDTAQEDERDKQAIRFEISNH